MEPREEEARPQAQADDQLVITRTFDAPKALVYQAWTEPEHVKHWWGPKGFTTPVVEIELKKGGKIRTCMRSPEGKDFWSIGEYREVGPDRIVCTDSFADEAGNVVEPTSYGMGADWPREALITVDFVAGDGKTRLTLRHGVDKTTSGFDDCKQGWGETLDRLADYLARI